MNIKNEMYVHSYLGSFPAMEEVETIKILLVSDEFRLETVQWND